MSSFGFGQPQRGITLWSYQWQLGQKSSPLAIIAAGAIFFVVGSVFLAVGAISASHEHRLAIAGTTTMGTVTKKHIEQANDNGTTNTSYDVDYTFSTADGHQIQSSATVDPDEWDRFKKGDQVQIEYLPTKPKINRIGTSTGISAGSFALLGLGSPLWLVGSFIGYVGLRAKFFPKKKQGAQPGSAETEADQPLFGRTYSKTYQLSGRAGWSMFGGILLVAGVIVLLIGIVNMRQERKFAREGKVASGILLTKSSRQEYDQQNHRYYTHYILSYRFTTANGNTAHGSTEVRWRTWTDLHERDPIQIAYLPEHPETNRLASQHTAPLLLYLVIVVGALVMGVGTIALACGSIALPGKRVTSALKAPKKS